jgi:L-Lysine epsilon oxidase N-terminal/L-lysine epsilon oxidase C-terminal domain
MGQIDETIVSAAIYPAIGIARVGNSRDGYFIGPEVTAPMKHPAGFYKDATGALKRQAARFRVYGLNAAGKVVKELTADNAQLTWQVHVANKKAAWYEFDVALDIPQAKPVPLRNANFQGPLRQQLIIDPGPVEITGVNTSGTQYRFDRGKFIGEPLYLGELRTDDQGRLLFLGGHGESGTPFSNNPPTTFANNNGWHDDVSDGPVDAEVIYEGRSLAVEGAWVVCAPPNYAPDIISVQTMYDVIVDALNNLYIPVKSQPSFMEDIYPLLQQLSMNQWVNQGFYVAYGYQQPYDFSDPELLRRLSTVTKNSQGKTTDDYREYRRQIFNYFRSPTSPQIEPQRWPWMYGDNMAVPAKTANGYLALTTTLYGYLQQWMEGNFVQDWKPDWYPPTALDAIADPQQQADMLTRAALWYCLGGPFHPGCEMTWPMRLSAMYTGPFRIRRRSPNNPEPDYGETLAPEWFQNQNYFTTPLSVFWNGPGDITRWMACPWQTDTASCRAGYESQYDPLIPTFWPARVPNTVLTEHNYTLVMNTGLPREERLGAFNQRASWYRILGTSYLDQIANMIRRYGDLGVVEYRPGIPNDADFPADMYVESKPYAAGGTGGQEATGGLAEASATQRNRLVEEAEQIPYTRGLYVGHVGRAARQR